MKTVYVLRSFNLNMGVSVNCLVDLSPRLLSRVIGPDTLGSQAPLLPPRLAYKHVTGGGERVSSAVQHHATEYSTIPSIEQDTTCLFIDDI